MFGHSSPVAFVERRRDGTTGRSTCETSIAAAIRYGGISSAGTFAPVYDAQKRPITAGGFVDSGPVVFEDASKASGLSKWQHVMGTLQKKYILETDGSGVGLIDYDNDGWLDIYLVNGSTYDAMSGIKSPPHAALFHNNHDGTFTDVAAKAGVINDRWASVWPSATTTTMTGRTLLFATSARTASSTTTTMARSPTWAKTPA